MAGSEKISLVIITKNEEKNIQRCLESAKDVVDEIIVIDSFSTDKTQEICEQYNVKFVGKEWMGYSKTKNFGNSLAQYDWILSLDADEALSEPLKKAILIQKNGFNSDAYYCNRITRYCGTWINHSGWYPDPKMRLWRKEAGSWKGDIHENVKLKKGTKIEKLEGNLLHYSINSIFEHQEQINKFSEIYAKSAFESGKRTHLLNIVFKPFERFLTTYFFKLGLLDGYNGLLISILTAHAIFLRHVKLQQFWNDFEKNEKEDQ